MNKNKKNFVSILDNNDLDDYCQSAEMDSQQVEVKRVHQNHAYLIEPSVAKSKQQTMSFDQFDYKQLKIPRKPSWNRQMSAEDVDRREKDSFLQWRREIASMELSNSSLKVTPFEKNLEVWRQLWRVMERSDFAVQIVDARNPLMYFTADLMRYAAEHSPPRAMMLVVNKSDFLTEYQRSVWATYFRERGIPFVFYSAQAEQLRIDQICKRTADAASDQADHATSDDEDEEQEEEDDEEEDNAEEEKFEEEERRQDPPETDAPCEARPETLPTAAFPEDELLGRLAPLSREELLQLLGRLPAQDRVPQPRHDGRFCVGLLGYPNVGKSSVINTLLGVSKSFHGRRVGVSSTPGKTKHFQTLVASAELLLCDCPGLVFPSFMRSTGEMLCAGILPINQMREYEEPIAAIAGRVSRPLLDATYGMRIRRELDLKDRPDRPPAPAEVLAAYCAVKGYITNGTGRWDEFRAAKDLIRDFNDGRLLHVFCPPPDAGLPQVDAARWTAETERTMLTEERVVDRLAKARLQELSEGAEQPMVFGAGPENGWDGSFEDGDESEDEESEAATGADAEQSEKKREHKRYKQWGKKNKKLRNKNPYGEDSGSITYVAYSTNRTRVGVVKPAEELERRRQDPRQAYGVPFTRSLLPHHAAAPDTG